MNIFIRSSGDP